jgi:cell division protein FtsQ
MLTELPLRRDAPYAAEYDDPDNFAEDSDGDFDFNGRIRRPGLRLRFHGGLVPKTLLGRILGVCALLVMAGACVAAGLYIRSFVLHDEHFLVSSADAIQIDGISRLSRPQLLSVFGEDVERNIFNIPLTQRRAELESLPWVEHATVMRLLPNRIRVSIVERTPVAFVRQGSEIGLVDANGVLLNLPGPDLSGTDLDEASSQQTNARDLAKYSFPVLTGISAADPLSTRAARMKIYLNFIAALDAGGEKVSQMLSEIDVSSPEDVKAVIPDTAAGGADVLVHFGDGRFLERYQLYQQHLAEWRAQYPRLASADMRYERQVVLEMAQSTPADALSDESSTTPTTADTRAASMPAPVPPRPAPAAKSKSPAKPLAKPTSVAHSATIAHAATKPAVKAAAQGVAR